MAQLSFTVLSNTTVYRWLLTIIFGSLFNAIVMGVSEYGSSSSLLNIIIYWIIFFFYGTMFSIPTLIVLIVLSRQLNKRTLEFSRYVILHNAFHLLIAVVSFGVLAILETPGEGIDIFILAVCYTLAGFLVWNGAFLLDYPANNRL